NAPIESFFGHFKDDVDYKEASSLLELKIMVDEYMGHYNCTRKQWDIKKMTPEQYEDTEKLTFFYDSSFFRQKEGTFRSILNRMCLLSLSISYFYSFRSFNIRLRFTANIVVAPCISIPNRPTDFAVL